MMSQTLKYGFVGSLLTAASLCFAADAHAVASAELYKTTALRYGKFAARVWFPAGDGIVGSFFLWKQGSEKPGTFWNELDFEKIKAGCEMHLNSIYGNPKADHISYAEVPGGACTGYHTYAFEWTPSYIAWFVDGKEVRRDTGTGAKVYEDNAKQGMVFDFNVWPGIPAFGGNFSESSLPVHQFISWVEYSAYTPGAGTDGSDFKLTWRESFEGSRVPTGWATGTWPSPLAKSTHATQNVKILNGVAVLSLTADDAKGYTGTPPVDDGDLPTVTGTGTSGAGGATSTGGATTGGSAGAGASAGTSTGSGGASSAGSGSAAELGDDTKTDDGGCSCSTAPQRSARFGVLTLLLGLALVFRRKRAPHGN